MKKILILIAFVIVLQGCVNNLGDVVNDDNIPEENTIEISQEEYEYVEFEYDYPKMSEVPSEYIPDGYQYKEGEKEKFNNVMNITDYYIRADLIIEEILDDSTSLQYEAELLIQLMNIYGKLDNGYLSILTIDSMFDKFDYYFDSQELMTLYMNKIYKLSDMDGYTFDIEERNKLHKYIISAGEELIKVYVNYEEDTKDNYKVYDTYMLMGYMYELLGEHEAAYETYCKILDFKDEFRTVEFTSDIDYRHYLVAMSAIRAGLEEEALKHINILYELSPDQGYYLDVVTLYSLYYRDSTEVLDYINQLEENENELYLSAHDKALFRMLQIEVYDYLGHTEKIRGLIDELLYYNDNQFRWVIDMGYEEKYDIDLHEIKLYYSDKFVKLRDFEF